MPPLLTMKSSHRALSIAALLIVPGFAGAQDECISALPIAAGATHFDTTAATLSAEPWTCATVTTAPDLWFTYVAIGGLPITIDTCGSVYAAAFSVHRGTCGALIPVGCYDEFCGTQRSFTFTPVVGTTYIIRVGGWGASFGAGRLNVFDRSAPTNVECVDARAIDGDGDIVVTTNASTSPPAWPCSNGTVFTHGRDVWFTYTTTFAGDFTIDTCNAGTTFDTVLEFFEGTCGSLTSLACNDDVACTPSSRSAINYCGAAGATYTFRVGGYNGASGTAQIRLTEAARRNCVTTTFPGHTSTPPGGAVYFDATFSQPVIIGGFETHANIGAGTPIVAQVLTRTGTYVGNTHSAADWMLVGIADGLSAGFGALSTLTFQDPLTVPAGTIGIAIVGTNFGLVYTAGNGANRSAMSPDGVISLTLGAASSVAFGGGGHTNPNVWNGSLCYDVNIGSAYCFASPNSSGSPASLLVGGLDCATADTLFLTSTSLPANVFGYFLASTTRGSSSPPGSVGTLCLGGAIGRAVGGVLASGAAGIIRTASDLTLPHPVLGSVRVMAGDTWNYQAWFRDSVGGTATSNLSDAASVTYH